MLLDLEFYWSTSPSLISMNRNHGSEVNLSAGCEYPVAFVSFQINWMKADVGAHYLQNMAVPTSFIRLLRLTYPLNNTLFNGQNVTQRIISDFLMQLFNYMYFVIIMVILIKIIAKEP